MIGLTLYVTRSFSSNMAFYFHSSLLLHAVNCYPESKDPRSTSIRYRSDAKVSDRYIIDVDPKVFAIQAAVQEIFHFQNGMMVISVGYVYLRVKSLFRLSYVIKITSPLATWAPWCLPSPATPQLVRTIKMENVIKTPHYCPFVTPLST